MSLWFLFHKRGNKASNMFLKVHHPHPPPPPPPSNNIKHTRTVIWLSRIEILGCLETYREAGFSHNFVHIFLPSSRNNTGTLFFDTILPQTSIILICKYCNHVCFKIIKCQAIWNSSLQFYNILGIFYFVCFLVQVWSIQFTKMCNSCVIIIHLLGCKSGLFFCVWDISFLDRLWLGSLSKLWMQKHLICWYILLVDIILTILLSCAYLSSYLYASFTYQYLERFNWHGNNFVKLSSFSHLHLEVGSKESSTNLPCRLVPQAGTL